MREGQAVVGSTALTNYLGVGLWLGFYPLAYVALMLFMRGKLRIPYEADQPASAQIDPKP